MSWALENLKTEKSILNQTCTVIKSQMVDQQYQNKIIILIAWLPIRVQQ